MRFKILNHKNQYQFRPKLFFLIVFSIICVFSFWYFTRTSVTIIGDSFTAEGTITKALKYKYKIYNCGVSGTTITNTGAKKAQSFVNRITDIPDADVIVIYGGINDFNTGVHLGKFEDGWANDTTFYGALHTLVRRLKSNHPNSNFLLCTPMHIDFALKGCDSKKEYAMNDEKIEPVHYLGGAFYGNMWML